MTDNKYDAEMQKLYNEMMKTKDESAPSLPVVCPTTFDKPCRLCDLCKAILFKRDNEGTPIRTLAGEKNRKSSYYSNVVMPTNPSEIVILQYGDTIWKKLMLYQMGPVSEIKDFTDPRTGRNIIITKTVVGGNKRRTQYSTEARINPSPLLDMSILRKLGEEQYQLHNILELIKLGKVKPFYQSMLADGPNEVRFLPSWLGPGISKFFQLVKYHYGTTQEEFDLIQKGELDPFAGIGAGVSIEPTTPKTWKSVDTEPPMESKPRNQAQGMWDAYMAAPPTPQMSTTSHTTMTTEQLVEDLTPPCFGKQYDVNDIECTQRCKEQGWDEACKTATDALARATFEKRKTAKRLAR